MRILQMCNVRWYNANAHYAVELSRGLIAAGHEVTLWAGASTPLVQKAEAAGIPVVTHQKHDPFKLLRLWWLVKRGRYEILNVHRGPDLFLAMLLKFIHQVIVVVSRSDIRPFKNNAVNRWFFAQQVDLVILSGRFQLEQGLMAPFAVPQECISVIPLGSEMPPLEPVKLRPRPFRFVMVARFDPVKGHRVLLDAFRLARFEMPDAELGLIGYPAAISTTELRQFARGLPVHVIDHPVNMKTTLAGYQVGIIASNASEAVARAGLEYLNRGMPVIGTRVNSIPELIDAGVNGLLVPPDDPSALAQALVKVYREYITFQAGVMRTRDLHSLERMVADTVANYGQLQR